MSSLALYLIKDFWLNVFSISFENCTFLILWMVNYNEVSWFLESKYTDSEFHSLKVRFIFS